MLNATSPEPSNATSWKPPAAAVCRLTLRVLDPACQRCPLPPSAAVCRSILRDACQSQCRVRWGCGGEISKASAADPIPSCGGLMEHLRLLPSAYPQIIFCNGLKYNGLRWVNPKSDALNPKSDAHHPKSDAQNLISHPKSVALNPKSVHILACNSLIISMPTGSNRLNYTR